MGKKTIEVTIETCDARTGDLPHCWHRSPYTFTTYPTQWDETCCHCGQTKRVHGSLFGSVNCNPSQHGPYYQEAVLYNAQPCTATLAFLGAVAAGVMP